MKNPVLKDLRAEKLVDRINYDFTKFHSQVGARLRVLFFGGEFVTQVMQHDVLSSKATPQTKPDVVLLAYEPDASYSLK